MRAFVKPWPDAEIVQQTVEQFPWRHNLVLLTRLKGPQQGLAYARTSHDDRFRNSLPKRNEVTQWV